LAYLTLTIDGEPWSETEDLTQSGPNDRHYVFDRDTGQISFGDGKHGAVPAAGATFNLELSISREAGGKFENLYRLDVPQGGKVTITTYIAAHEEPDQTGERAKRLGCLTAILGALAVIFARRSRR
jgi:hypothetical protein